MHPAPAVARPANVRQSMAPRSMALRSIACQFFARPLPARQCAAALVAVGLVGAPLVAAGQIVAGAPASLTPVQQKYYEIYKELVEINTTHSVGDNTVAARAMARHLADAGFAGSEMEIVEPFPKKGNLVVRWKGSGERGPLLLLAHIDVVEAKPEDWKTDPFKLQETDGYFTARGAYDDKAMASALVSVLAQLRTEGWKPNRDVILALTADEERGDVESNGVLWMTRHRPELLKAEVGINEGGGGELRGGKPVLHRLQVAEKMYTSYTAEVRDAGGHSSLPTATNPIYALAAGLERLGQYRFPVKLAEVTQTYFSRTASLVGGQVGDDMKAAATGTPDPAAIDRLHAVLQRDAPDHLCRDDGHCRPCRECAAAVGQGDHQLPDPAA